MSSDSVPSSLSNHPSKTGEMLVPNCLGGVLGNGSCASKIGPPASAINAQAARTARSLMRRDSTLWGGTDWFLPTRLPILILGIAQVIDIHPRMRHLVDSAIAVADPLIGIGIVLVGSRVVVVGGDVDHRSLRERRCCIIGVDVVGHPVEVEVLYVTDDLRTTIRQDRLDLHHLAAQVEVRLEIRDDGI